VTERDQPAGPHCSPEEGCITCGDVGVAMTVIHTDPDRGLALCADELGQRSSVETALVAGVGHGDRLLVHAGTAIARLDEGAVVA
jgi:hydrogenase maturation factor